jgi:hypothetical protein
MNSKQYYNIVIGMFFEIILEGKDMEYEFERIPTDDPIRHLWNRLDILTTISGAKNFLEVKVKSEGIIIDRKIVHEKAKGIAFSIRTAKEYFSQKIEGNLTTASLSYYYGTLSLLKTLILSNVNNQITLDDIERFTQFGHGLRLVQKPGDNLLNSEYLMIVNSGFFNNYLKLFGYDLKNIAVSKGVKFDGKDSVEDLEKVISVMDIISRIPELKGIYLELFNQHPNYVSYSTRGNNDVEISEVDFGIHENSKYLNEEKILDIMGWKNIQLELIEEYGSMKYNTKNQAFSDLLNNREQYNSVFAYSSYIKPINHIGDKLLFDFMFLYTLSIWVRYRPALWREITEGELDIYRPLITNFLIQVERTVPNIVLNRLYNKYFLFAGFSYFS